MSARLALVVLAAALAGSGCRCKGDTKVGDKRAFACAEVPSKDEKYEIDLGDGAKLVRDGVRAVLQGTPPPAPNAPATWDARAIAVTSFEGGAADLVPPDDVAAVFVVGLGGLDRKQLAASLSSLAKHVPLVVVASGPEDEVDVVRAAIGDAGKRVVDGGLVRAVVVGGLEAVAIPGSDDASSLAEHGRGCVVREEDVKALAAKLGPVAPDRVRLAIAFAAPSRDEKKPAAADALGAVAAWAIAGPVDADADPDLAIAKGAHAPLVPVPRASKPRTTSVPAVVSPGFLVARVQDGVLRLVRGGGPGDESDTAPDPGAAPSDSAGSPSGSTAPP